MSLTPRLSRRSEKSDNFIEECRAAFICMTNNASDKFKSKKQLTQALQCCGRNPNLKRIDNYWDKYKDGIGFDEFCQIVEKENEVTEDELIKAFRIIDVNDDGYISFNELYNMLSNKGEKLSREDVQEVLDSADVNKDGKLDYKEFSKLVIQTVDKTKDLARQRMKFILKDDSEEKGKKSRENSRNRAEATSPTFDERSKRAKSPLSARSNKSEDSFEKRSNHGSRSNSLRRDRAGSDSDDQSLKSKTSNKQSSDAIEIKLQAPAKIQDVYQQPSNLKKWLTGTIKGAFYLNDKSDHIISNSYVLELREDSKVFFEIEPYVTEMHKSHNSLNMDALLIIVQDDRNKGKRLRALTKNKIQNKWCVKCSLEAGRYFIFPFTSGCYLKKRHSEIEKDSKQLRNMLMMRDSKGRNKLTDKYLDTLNTIFDICDLDSNNRLNRNELNLYTYLTEGENLTDEAWKMVEEKVGLKKNELLRDSFIQLAEMETERDDVDINDIWLPLLSLGFNKNLEIDQCCPYKVIVSCEKSEFNIYPHEIFKLNTVESFLHEHILEKGQRIETSVKSMRDINLFEYHNEYMAIFLVENRRPMEITLKLNYENSENCLFNNQNTKSYGEVKAKADKRKLGLVAVPKNLSKDWIIRITPTNA